MEIMASETVKVGGQGEGCCSGSGFEGGWFWLWWQRGDNGKRDCEGEAVASGRGRGGSGGRRRIKAGGAKKHCGCGSGHVCYK